MDDEAKSKSELITELHVLRRQLMEHTVNQHGDDGGPATRRSAQLFAQAFKVNPAAIAITRLADSQYIDVNDRFLELMGYSSEEVIGHTSQELGLWADPPERTRVSQILAEQGIVLDVDIRFRARNGDIVDGRTSLTFIDIDDAPCILTVVQDVTNQLRAERAQQFLIEASTMLSASLDYKAILADFVRLAIAHLADWCAVDVYETDGSLLRFVADPDGRCLEVGQHPGVHDASAEPPAVLDTGQADLMTQVSEPILRSVVQDPAAIERLRQQGVRSSMVVPLNARGRMLGAISFITAGSGRRYRAHDLRLAEDLARRVALALDNALLYREAQQALEARDAFLSVAAHELKTPATLILAHAELLQRRAEREGTASERDLRSLHMLGAQTHRLDRLIQAVLDVSRLQGGALVLDRHALDLVELARHVVEEFTVMVTDHQLLFVAASEPQIVEGDSLRLEQVLQNLVQNAIKYSPNGSTIRVQVERLNAEVALSVGDQGIGVPQAVIPELFRPFYRAKNIDPGVAGLGIGLYVVKELVSLHNGSVQVDSSEGQGSRFTVLLPLRVQEG
jgi:PAS domain S-box-containing protein